MKVITHKDILRLEINPLECYHWIEEMIAKKNDAILPAKISMKPQPSAFCNVMPSIIPGGVWGGVKAVTRYPDRTPSLDSKILLYNAQQGDFKAIMDGNWITAMRTGSVAAYSIKLLAKKNFSQIGIIGLGNTARATLTVLCALFPERRLEIKLLKYKGQEELFAERFADKENIRFRFVDTYEQIVRGSDVVISAVTYFSEDICADEVFDEGVLVVPIHTLGFTNCDLFFDKVFADDYGHVCHFKNFQQFKSFAEVTDVINGKAVGREHDAERILAYNIGVSTHDIFFASKIYEKLENQLGADLDFYEPKEKFWM